MVGQDQNPQLIPIKMNKEDLVESMELAYKSEDFRFDTKKHFICVYFDIKI